MNKLFSAVVAVALALSTIPGCGPSAPSGPNSAGGPPPTLPTGWPWPRNASGGPNSTGGPNSAGGPNDPLGTAVTLQELLAGLPADALPKGADDTVRMDRANDWLKANAPGKRIACDYYVNSPELNRVGDTRNYSVTFYGAEEDGSTLPKQNFVKVNGVSWQVCIGTEGGLVHGRDISLHEVPDDVAEKLSGLKNKVVKLTATVTGAAFTKDIDDSPLLNVGATRYILDGIKTGLPLALDHLKAAADPAARKAAIQEVMRRTPSSGDVKTTLAALADLLKDKDEGVRQAAALGTAALDPTSKVDPDLIPRKATVDGKYTNLLRVLHTTKDKDQYGEFTDNGKSDANPDYQGYKDIPAGYWVYVYPYWFIWKDQKQGSQ